MALVCSHLIAICKFLLFPSFQVQKLGVRSKNKGVNAVALVCGHLVVVVRGFGFTNQLIKEKGEERDQIHRQGQGKRQR